jgi:hypothetical protein
MSTLFFVYALPGCMVVEREHSCMYGERDPYWSLQVKPGYVPPPTFSSSRNSLWDTPGEKLEGSRMVRVLGAILEPSGFSPDVSQRELRELEKLGGAT